MLLDVPNDIIKHIIRYFLPTQKSFLLMAGVCIECQISDIKHLNSKLKELKKKKKPFKQQGRYQSKMVMNYNNCLVSINSRIKGQTMILQIHNTFSVKDLTTFHTDPSSTSILFQILLCHLHPHYHLDHRCREHGMRLNKIWIIAPQCEPVVRTSVDRTFLAK